MTILHLIGNFKFHVMNFQILQAGLKDDNLQFKQTKQPNKSYLYKVQILDNTPFLFGVMI